MGNDLLSDDANGDDKDDDKDEVRTMLMMIMIMMKCELCDSQLFAFMLCYSAVWYP